MAKAPAVVFAEASRPVTTTVDVADPGPDEVLVRTLFSAVSPGTERWVLTGQFYWHDVRFPCVPGYQRVGHVLAVGRDVTHVNVGDVVLATISRLPAGVSAEWGAHVALAVSPASEVLALPPGVDALDAAAAVVAQVGYNAASRLTATSDSWVLVYGDGLIGQFAAQAARARGYRPILVGHHQRRLDLADWCAETLDNRVPITTAAVSAITGGELPAAVLDTVQNAAAESEYLTLLDGRLEVVYCGFTPAPAWADMARLQQREATAHFVSGWTRDRLAKTLELMASGHLRFASLVTDRAGARHASELHELLLRPGGDHLGLLIDWEG